MKFKHTDFSPELLKRIEEIETSLQDYIPVFLETYEPALRKRGLTLSAEFTKSEEPFNPGYYSELSVGVTDETGELTGLHIIPIWECTRQFAGIPVSIKIPGSSVTGELLDESLHDVKEELKEYIELCLEEDQ